VPSILGLGKPYITPSEERLERFDELLLGAIDEVLKFILGDKSARGIYDYLEKRSCTRNEIPLKLEIFSIEMRNVLNDNRSSRFSDGISTSGRVIIVERTIAKILCRKIEMEFSEAGPINLPSFISDLRSLYVNESIQKKEENKKRPERSVEEILEISKEKYRELTESITDVFFAMDRDLRYIFWNKASERLTGVSAKDAVGKTLTEVFPDTKETKVEQLYLEVLKTKQPKSFFNEYNIGGKGFIFEINAYPIKDGLSVIAKDMTERKHIEEKMEYQQNLFDALMDNMPDVIYFKDTESRFIRVSKVSCPGLGIKSPEEAVGMTDFDFAPRELAEQFYADDQMVMKTGKPIIGKEEVMISKVSKTWYSATKVPIKNKDGKVIGLVGISRDISKIKETEEELKRYSTQLEEVVEERTKKLQETQRLATIGETAAMVGHDLRNPLQTIAVIPYLVEQIVQSLPVPAKEIVEKNGLPGLIKTLRDQTIYMNKIVSDLQDYARQINLEPMETNLYDMINEIISTTQIPENIEVRIEIEHDFFATLDSLCVFSFLTMRRLGFQPLLCTG